jgi:hypothetical protein
LRLRAGRYAQRNNLSATLAFTVHCEAHVSAHQDRFGPSYFTVGLRVADDAVVASHADAGYSLCGLGIDNFQAKRIFRRDVRVRPIARRAEQEKERRQHEKRKAPACHGHQPTRYQEVTARGRISAECLTADTLLP